jgi:DNA-binding CsgD family transcriptional regulator
LSELADSRTALTVESGPEAHRECHCKQDRAAARHWSLLFLPGRWTRPRDLPGREKRQRFTADRCDHPSVNKAAPALTALKHVAIYGACGGALILAMRLVEYRFLVVEHSVEIYAAIIAAAFAALGIWLGLTITGRPVVVKEVTVEVPVEVRVPAAGSFTVNTAKLDELGITARELDVLRLIAEGLSTKEMAERLFVSENTVKTHTSRVFDKLGANRRTKAVQLAKELGLLA